MVRFLVRFMVRFFGTMFDTTASAGSTRPSRARFPVRALARSPTMAACLLAASIGIVGSLDGCSLGLPAAVANIRYDLGPAPTLARPAAANALPPLRLLDVRAPRSLETDEILYRMSYADPRQTAAYANSHWTMRPSQLLTERVRDALAARGAVVGGGQAVQAPLLTIELEQFEQVFDSEGQSHGALTARATLTNGGKVIAQQTFVARAPASMPNAAGGVHALAAASDDFVAQLVAWLGMQAGVLTQ
jgi:cholesterol transport system auxiliary component